MKSFYSSFARPLLFSLDAETAHSVAKFGLGLPLPWSAIGGVPEHAGVDVDLAGLKLRNPVGLAAGFDKDCRRLDALSAIGFGYVVGGTVTLEPRSGNARPRIGRYPERRSLVNAMGFPNRGAESAYVAIQKSQSSPRLVSISGSTADEVLRIHDRLAPAVDAIEFNVSCPNVRWGRDVDTEKLLTEVLAQLPRDQKPLFVKLPPYREAREREAILALVKIAADGGVKAITASNTLPVDEPKMSIGSGGLSGRAITQDTVRIVGDVYRATDGKMPINACGGIFDADDAIACIRAGATTVQVYTGFIYEGPRIVRNIVTGLRQAVSRQGSLRDLVGAAA
jgi:dihydroorotate dehydrogenase